MPIETEALEGLVETLEGRGITSQEAATWSTRTSLATVEVFPLQDTLVKGPLSEAFVTVPDQLWCIQVTSCGAYRRPGAFPGIGSKNCPCDF